jgi:tetratricopeptide (TPR) repeat protein
MVAVLLAGCAATPPEDDAGTGTPGGGAERVAEARAAAEAGEYAYALELLMEALADSDDPAVARQAAQLAIAMNDPGTAERAAARWLELEPDSRQAAQVAVVAALQQGRSEAAAELLYERLIETASDRERAWVAATALLAEADAPDAARAALADAVGRVDAPAPGLRDYLESRLLARLDRLDEAWTLAQAARAASPGYERAMWAARLAQRRDDSEAALENFRRARAHRPADRVAAIGLVQVLQSLDRPGQALAVLDDLPVDAELLYTRGLLEQELGRMAEAGATWQRLASLEGEAAGPRHAWLTGLLAELLRMREQAVAWYQRVDGELAPRADLRRAILLGDMGRLDAARRVLADLRLGADPGMRERSWLVEGGLLVEAGAYDDAIELYSESLTKLPGSSELLYARAMAAVQADQLPLAEQDLRAMIQNDPENALALNALGYTLADMTDRHREALRLIETALALDPDNPAILDSMGWVLYRLGRSEAALPYLQRAARADPHPEIVAHLIEVLWVLERRDEANEWIARYGDEHAGEPVFDATLKRLGVE